MSEDGKVNLEHDGKVWLLDFWATWCPPCQRPMAHNQEMLEKKGDEWKDKIRIIGLSIDQDKAKLKSHVEAKGWGKVEHFWRSGSDCSKVYSVSGVPHVMLINKEGLIVFKGHPANRPNLEEDLEKLANGGTITGEGCASASSSGDGSSDAVAPEGMKDDLDSA
jgi:thiol-disulfide isomerase/thioredoxin